MRAPIRQHALLLTSVAVSLVAWRAGGVTGGPQAAQYSVRVGGLVGAVLEGVAGQPWAGLFHRRVGPRS